MSIGASGRLAVAVAVVLAALVHGVAPTASARPIEGDATSAASLPVLTWPVTGRIIAGWHEPAGPYGPGHRGVDLAVARGQRVGGMAAGVVGWAGVVAGTAWVSVDHAAGVRTTVGPMATIVVGAGDVVETGTAVGTAIGVAHPVGPAAPERSAAGAALHVSVRIDGVYVDPATLVGTLVPTLLPSPT